MIMEEGSSSVIMVSLLLHDINPIDHNFLSIKDQDSSKSYILLGVLGADSSVKYKGKEICIWIS